MNSTSERKLKSRDRNSNFSPEEVDHLLTLIEAKKDIVENKNKNANTWREKDTIWRAIEIEFNSKSTMIREAKHLKLKYEALKRDVRKKITLQSSISVPYNDSDNTSKSRDHIINSFKEIQFTPPEKKVLAIIHNINPTTNKDRIKNVSEEKGDKIQNAVIEEVVIVCDPEEFPENTNDHDCIESIVSERKVFNQKYYSPEISIQRHEKIHDSKKRGLKRNFTEKESLQELPKKLATLDSTSSKNMTGPPKIGIRDSNRLLSEQELRLVQDSILQLIDEETLDSEYCPRFLGCVLEEGWLAITCADERSQTWLAECVNNLKPWEGASLIAIDEHHFPKPQVCMIRIPRSSLESKVLMQRLSVQNKEIGCQNWRLVSRKPSPKPDHETVIFTIDQKSHEALRAQDFKLYFNFGQIIVHCREITMNELQSISDYRTAELQPSNRLQKTTESVLDSVLC